MFCQYFFLCVFYDLGTETRWKMSPEIDENMCFFGGGFWQASGDRYLKILVDVWDPWGCHLAPKWGLNTRAEKNVKKGGLRKRVPGSLGPLKVLRSSHKQQADDHKQLAASRMAIGMGMGMRMVGMGMRIVSKAQERPSWPAARWRINM